MLFDRIVKRYKLPLTLAALLLLAVLAIIINFRINSIVHRHMALLADVQGHTRQATETLRLLSKLMVRVQNGSEELVDIHRLSRSQREMEKAFYLLESKTKSVSKSGTEAYLGNTDAFMKVSDQKQNSGKITLSEISAISMLFNESVIDIIAEYPEVKMNRNALVRSIETALRYSQLYNEKFAGIERDLLNVLEIEISRERRHQVIANLFISLVLCCALFALFYFQWRTRENESKLEASVLQADDILDSVDIGLLLLDNKLIVDTKHSTIIKNIFGKEDFVGRSFVYLFKDVVSQKTLKRSINYFKFLFSQQVNEKMIREVNPLQCIKINITSEDGGIEKKYIQCEFKRIIREGKITRVLVVIQDITKSVKLEHMLRQSTSRTEQQMSTITSILQFERNLVEDFILDTSQAFRNMQACLSKTIHGHADGVSVLDELFRIVHKVKGDAAILELCFLARHLHEFETMLETLKTKDNLNSSDFLVLCQPLKTMMQSLFNIKDTMDRLTEGDWSQDGTQDNSLFSRLDSYAKKISADTKKEVRLIDDGFSRTHLPERLRKGIADVTVQLLRNAIVHGIESSEGRRAAQKTSYGCVHLGVTKHSDSFTITVRDDGAGLDIDKIKQKAISSGQYSRAAVAKWSNKQVMNLILQPGFSTADEVSEHAGRGVGLDVIKSTIEKLGGKLSTSTRKGMFTEFSMTFPR